MDSSNPFCSSQEFVNLLTSQEEHTLCFSPSQEFGSSDVPRFSSQVPDQPSVKERRKWSPVEDVVLISARLNTSKDLVIGNEQKAGDFWKRIIAYFNSSPQLANEQDRESGQLNDHVCKFVGSYETAMTEQTSGQNENDLMKAAQQIFYNDHLFKWKAKRRKLDETSAHSSSSQTQADGEDVSMARPPGVKASKAAKKKEADTCGAKEGGKAVKEFQIMWEIKDKDLAMKRQLSRSKVLASLLAKPEPLSEIEEALKIKLMNEMFGKGNIYVALENRQLSWRR
ncbi:glutathione S-transferase T3-like [Eutrema salsugineum]|uniref:glutathione S-transferase T3-like n=1 Tax=Eutrema salsugineum TaxID=72664 RepID=UPI000CED3DEA|nr:glutathione S-transferase T3-like [Eutrema salsugineum]